MAHEFHDTAHIEKRARERGFSVEEAMLTIKEARFRSQDAGAKGKPRRIHLVVPRSKAMNAGSSPGTGKNRRKSFVIPITEPPVVEIDTEATAAYVRLRNGKIAHTEPYESAKGLVTLDFDAKRQRDWD
jgi:hypothetical protein